MVEPTVANSDITERRGNQLTQQELEQRLLAACNRLRGPVDPTDFKAYIFPLLFFKRISDYWDWEYARALAAFDGDEELALLDDNFRFILPGPDPARKLPGCHWADFQVVGENVGAALHKMLQRIEQANPQTLAGIFGDVQWSNKEKLPEPALIGLRDEFSTFHFDPETTPGDVMGDAYEYLLKYFADESGKKAGEFFTPRHVTRALAEILDPQDGESIHDPTCGSGGMLIEVVNHVRRKGGDPRTLKLSGQEVNLTTAAIARMNLFMHDIEDFRIRRGDTLRDPKFTKPDGGLEQYDCVIANPPFSLSPWGREEWPDDPYRRSTYGLPPTQYADLAFVEHMLAVMKPDTGRLAVVMPQGVLTRTAEREIRKRLLEAGLLDAVIGLPRNLFYNTDLPACIVVCRSQPAPARRGSVLFIDASARSVKDGTRNVMSADDIETVVTAYRTGVDPDGEGGLTSRLVPITEIAENRWDMNILSYMGEGRTADIDVEAAVGRCLETRDALRQAEERLDVALTEAGLLA
jgi:type I restriction enzyme M protein